MAINSEPLKIEHTIPFNFDELYEGLLSEIKLMKEDIASLNGDNFNLRIQIHGLEQENMGTQSQIIDLEDEIALLKKELSLTLWDKFKRWVRGK